MLVSRNKWYEAAYGTDIKIIVPSNTDTEFDLPVDFPLEPSRYKITYTVHNGFSNCEIIKDLKMDSNDIKVRSELVKTSGSSVRLVLSIKDVVLSTISKRLIKVEVI